MHSSERNDPPRIGGYALSLLIMATITVAAMSSAVYEFWLEELIYARLGWVNYETRPEMLLDFVQATIITAVAIAGPGFLLFRNIRKLAQAHTLLQMALRAAQSASVAKSQFLANMSHELRTPLNAVIGFSDLMVAEVCGPLAPRYKGYAADIRNAGLHLLDVINDVLDISKAEAVQLSVHVTDVDLRDLLLEVEALAAPISSSAQISMHFDAISSGAALVVRADRVRLKQALLNLVSNGIKFNNSGGSVSVRAFEDNSVVCIEIADTGIGMEPSQLENAFQPFIQLHTGHARKYEGTGLGLPLTKVLVEAMEGHISVRSEVGVGTVITLALPYSSSMKTSEAA